MALTGERATQTQARIVDRWYGNPTVDAETAAAVRQIIVETGGLHEAEAMTSTRIESAITALRDAPIDADVRTELIELARRLSARAN